MRAFVALLLLANLAFAAWALLIDRPEEAPAARDISHLQRLVLASEPAPGAAVAGSAPTPVIGVAAPKPTISSSHCVTVGPFTDPVLSAAASALLQTRGVSPTQRERPGVVVSYAVYLDNMASDEEANELLQTLRTGGLADARVMPATAANGGRRVSVGLFTERDGAARRAAQVKSLGLTPVITEQRQTQTIYWLDIAATIPGQTISTDGLLPATTGQHLEIRDCP